MLSDHSGTELRRQHEHYAGVRARLMAGSAPADNPSERLRPESPFSMRRIAEDRARRAKAAADAYAGLRPSGSWRDVIRQVAETHRCNTRDLLGYGFLKKLNAARGEAMYRLYRERAMSLAEIGRRFGGRDHSTVWYGIRNHCERAGIPMERQC